MRDHLLDGRTYQRLSDADCTNHKQHLEHEIKSWIKTYNKTLTKMERAFLKQGLEQNQKVFAGFYLTLKAHKLKPGQNMTHLKNRPIVTCPSSLLHPLGIWTDHKLQTLAKQQVSYFCNSYDRQDLCSTQYHPTAQLFTADTVSMYTNIPTNTAIMLIAKYIRKSVPKEHPKQNEALIAALKLVMLNNIFSFGDMTFKQLNGTTMETPPAPPPPPPPHMLRSIMVYTNQNFCPIIGNMSYSTSASLTTFSVSGYHIPIRKSMRAYGMNSPSL